MSETKTAKHTPGPWVIGGTLISNRRANSSRTKTTIATVLWRNRERRNVNDYDPQAPEDINETDANARLIAAAPDLLEALKETTAALLNWADKLDAKERDGATLSEIEDVVRYNARLLAANNRAAIDKAKTA